jgi:hypothetical protein
LRLEAGQLRHRSGWILDDHPTPVSVNMTWWPTNVEYVSAACPLFCPHRTLIIFSRSSFRDNKVAMILAKLYPKLSAEAYTRLASLAALNNFTSPHVRTFERLGGPPDDNVEYRSQIEKEISEFLNEPDLLPRAYSLHECSNRLLRYESTCSPKTTYKMLEISHHTVIPLSRDDDDEEAIHQVKNAPERAEDILSLVPRRWRLSYSETINMEGGSSHRPCTLVVAPTTRVGVTVSTKTEADKNNAARVINRELIGEGYHRRLHTTIELPPRLPLHNDGDDCDVILEENFSEDIYVDVYETSELLRLEGSPRLLIPKEMDLEKPSHMSNQNIIRQLQRIHHNNEVNENAKESSRRITFTLPVHFRYQPPQQAPFFHEVRIIAPRVLVKCNKSTVATTLPVIVGNDTLFVQSRIPVGLTEQSGTVVAVTLLVTLIGLMYIAVAVTWPVSSIPQQ